MFEFQGTDCNHFANWRLSNTHSLLKTVPQLHYTAQYYSALHCTELHLTPILSLEWQNCGCGVARREGQVPATHPTKVPSYYFPRLHNLGGIPGSTVQSPSPSRSTVQSQCPRPNPSPSFSPSFSPILPIVAHSVATWCSP